MSEARCCTCQFFTPDPIGFGAGIGNCQKYDDYQATNPSQKDLDKAFRRLGNQLFWGAGIFSEPRYCCKYKEKENA